MRARLLVLSVLTTILASSAFATGTAAAATSPQVVLAVESANPASVGSPVRLIARVSPSAVTGSVAFTVDGRVVARVALSDGRAATAFTPSTTGQFLVRATYAPPVGSTTWDEARSPVVTVAVGVGPRLAVRTATDVDLPSSAPVAAGAGVRLEVAGFPARVPVRFTIGSAHLPGFATTDQRGSATFSAAIPALAAREYLVVAYGGSRSAVATVLVDGLLPGASPTATFCPASPTPTSSASPTPTSPSPSSTSTPPGSGRPTATSGSPRSTRSTSRPTAADSGTATRSSSATESRGEIPDTGGSLSPTGAAVISAVVGGVLALLAGAALMRAGRRPRPGKHAR